MDGIFEETDFLKGLEDINWEEDWDDLCGLIGSDALCCVDQLDEICQANEIVPYVPSAPAAEQSRTALMPLSKQRFSKRVTDEEVSRAIQDRIPTNTVKSTAWCTRIFEDWSKERGVNKELVAMPADVMDTCLSQFVYEAVKQDGSPYPPNSLYQIIAGLQRHLRENGRPEIAFFDERSPVFDKLRKSLDSRMKQLAKDGLGMDRKSADPITREMESQLWEKGIFSRESGNGLLNIVYFYNCKFFGLRAGDEHRQLKVEQFSFGTSDGTEYVQFTGSTSKTYSGGLKHRRLSPKSLKIHSVPELGERDMVGCYRYYLSLIPGEGPFYRRPTCSKVTSLFEKPSFTKQVVGKNTLNSLVRRFCTEAGFSGNFTGHSGKVTCATELFVNNVDEQLIQIQTGHRSTSSVRCYKRPHDEHVQKISKILQPPPCKKGTTAVVAAAVDDEKENVDQADWEKPCVEPFSQAMTPTLNPMALISGFFGGSRVPQATIPAFSAGNMTFNFNLGSK